MKIALTVILIGLLFSCTSTSKIESDCTSKLKMVFDTSWTAIQGNKYLIKRSLQEIINIDKLSKECILKLDSSQIIRALGVPTEIGNKFWQGTKYTISYSIVISGKQKNEVAAYQFYCDSLNKVVATMFITNPTQRNIE